MAAASPSRFAEQLKAQSMDGLLTPAAVAEAEGHTEVLEVLRGASIGSVGAVSLNIYDVSVSQAVQLVNKVCRPVGTGAFHAGVEVHDKEWSFGATEDNGTGIFCCVPKQCNMHHFRESIPMGEVQLSDRDIEAILQKLEPAWKGRSYDLLRHNCCHFSDALCRDLGVGAAPRWVTNLAGAGATLQSTASAVATELNKTAIIACAKAGTIDKRFQVSETVVMSSQYNMRKVKELDAKLKITETIAMSADYNRRKVGEILSAGQEQRGSPGGGYKFGDFTRGVMSKLTKQ